MSEFVEAVQSSFVYRD